MNFKIISILTIVFLFLGCSAKVNKYAKHSDILHEQAMTQTKKTVIKVGKVTKVYFLATYINQISHKLAGFDDSIDRFIVNVYVPSEEKQKEYEKINFIINGIANKPVRELKIDDELLKIIPNATPWSKYYLFEVQKVERSKSVTLSFETSQGKSATLNFIKDEL